MAGMTTLTLNPDRLLPADPATRDIARELYAAVRDLPIISPHGHVPPQWLADDIPFDDPTSLLITPDHYINRMLHAHGVSLADLGVGQSEFTPEQSRDAFRHPVLALEGLPRHAGQVLVRVRARRHLRHRPGPLRGDRRRHLRRDRRRARRRRSSGRGRCTSGSTSRSSPPPTTPATTCATTRSSPPTRRGQGSVAPTFRPDKYLEPATAAWNGLVDTLGEVSGIDTGTYTGWVAAMEDRRAFFKANGAVSTDHSHRDARVEPLDEAEAERLYALARAGTITVEQGHTLRRAFMFQQARMASEDGLVMTLHPAVYRNHHTPTFEKYGADVGGDIPMGVEFVNALQPMLAAFGTAPNFQLVLFTIDETVYSRELAPLAGFYPSVFVGAPWWFIDSPEAMNRYRSAVTETAGFSRTSGFIDDTRAFLSIPARHDTNRRMDSGFLAKLVADHRLTMDEALDTAVDLVVTNPRKAFKL